MKKYILIFGLIICGISAAEAQKITDIRKVDFTNYTHKIGKDTVKFKNGLQVVACSKDAEGIPSGDIWNLEKSFVKYGDLDGDGKDEAMMSAVANVCGGNMVTNEAVLVYKLVKGKAVKLPEFEYYEDACETGKVCNFSRNPGVSVGYDKTAKALVVEQFYMTDDDAVCCPSQHRKTWFKWNGAKFAETKKSKLEPVK